MRSTPVALAACLFVSAPTLAQDDEWGDEDDTAVLGAETEGEDGGDEWGDEGEWGEGEGAVLGDDASASEPPGDEPPPPSESPADPSDAPEPAPEAPPPPPPAEPQAPPPGEPAIAPPADEAEPAAPGVAEEALIQDDGRRVGEPIPLTRREPLLPQFGVEAAVRYGLVGTGPTRFVNDIRFGVFDWLELRTSLLPHPASLMARFKIGSRQGPFGAVLLEGGLANFDAGFRLVPEEGEAEAGFRFHWEAIAAYTRSLGDRMSLYGSVHYRYRQSFLSDDDAHAIAADLSLSYDLLDYLAFTGGVSWAAAAFGSPVRELAVNFVEIDRPGMSHFLIRNDGQTYGVNVPLALTYARVENFDVDLFATTRLWPQLDIVFGAGVRWRLWFGDSPA